MFGHDFGPIHGYPSEEHTLAKWAIHTAFFPTCPRQDKERLWLEQRCAELTFSLRMDVAKPGTTLPLPGSRVGTLGKGANP